MEYDTQYPSQEDLDKISSWEVKNFKEFRDIFEFVEKIWWQPDWGIHKYDKEYHISTGGWSGNEDIIEAMRKNYILWRMCWVQSRRGGHYVFELPQHEIKESHTE